MHTRQFLTGLLYQLAVSVPIINAEPRARVLYTFQDGTFVENLVVRSNGNVLFGTFGQGHVYDIDPKASSTEPRLIAKLPGADAITGMAEVSPDVFTLVAGLQTGPVMIEDWKLFTLNLKHSTPAVKTVANLTGVGLLNGMTALPGKAGTVLNADSSKGTIWSIDYTTGKKRAVIIDEETLGVPEGAALPIGVNGIHVHGPYLYFTNSARGLFGRIPITKSGRQAGQVEVLVEKPQESAATGAWDDFAIAKGNARGLRAYIGFQPNAIDQVDLNSGTLSTFFGGRNNSILDGPTSVAMSKDQKRMYVTTSGATGTGGQIVEITL